MDMSITVGQRQSYTETKREEEERLQLEKRHETECNTFREVMGLRPVEAMEPKFADPADACDASRAASKKLLQGQLRQFTASGDDDAKFVSSIAFCARMLGEEPPSAKALTRAASRLRQQLAQVDVVALVADLRTQSSDDNQIWGSSVALIDDLMERLDTLLESHPELGAHTIGEIRGQLLGLSLVAWDANMLI